MENLILINKPKNWTSNDVVQKIKKSCKYKKVGHAGTLDPNATGLLILAANENTKLLSNLIIDDKEYVADIEFGFCTDSADVTGNVLMRQNPKKFSIKQLQLACNFFLNDYFQKPHKFSAVKINGKKAYEYARSNIDVKIKPKQVKVYDYEIIEYKDNKLKIRMLVSKGFYIRSFVEDLAKKLNSIACLIELKRTRCGQYKLEDACHIEQYINQKTKSNTL